MSISRRLVAGKHVETTVPKTTRLGVAAMFFVYGAAFANWVSRIPAVQQKLGLGTGALGLALLGMPVGLLLSTPTTGWLVTRMGSRSVTKIAALSYCMVLPLPALAPNLPLLASALVVVGAIGGAMILSMNTQGIAVERCYDQPLMSLFNGLFSLGGLVGAAGEV
ncbi:hypothetical protein [Scytonema sp. PRP1]|uniref:hypothetical protein n=1 Tax=Scytonema sp. PRP1 TaxID=3120513 RepID=UPI00300C1308